jgi:hypothetical protein
VIEKFRSIQRFLWTRVERNELRVLKLSFCEIIITTSKDQQLSMSTRCVDANERYLSFLLFDDVRDRGM